MNVKKTKSKAKRVPRKPATQETEPASLRVQRAVRTLGTIRDELLRQNPGVTNEPLIAQYVSLACELYMREPKPTNRQLWEASIVARAEAQEAARMKEKQI